MVVVLDIRVDKGVQHLDMDTEADWGKVSFQGIRVVARGMGVLAHCKGMGGLARYMGMGGLAHCMGMVLRSDNTDLAAIY